MAGPFFQVAPPSSELTVSPNSPRATARCSSMNWMVVIWVSSPRSVIRQLLPWSVLPAMVALVPATHQPPCGLQATASGVRGCSIHRLPVAPLGIGRPHLAVVIDGDEALVAHTAMSISDA
jgi:hypothetical protein